MEKVFQVLAVLFAVVLVLGLGFLILDPLDLIQIQVIQFNWEALNGFFQRDWADIDEEEPTHEPTATGEVMIATPTATATPSPTPTPTDVDEAHENRIRELAPNYDKSIEVWLREAGFSWESLELAARQPEEETFNDEVIVSGFQVTVTGLNAEWPASLTSDDPILREKADRWLRPDESNPSVLATDVSDFSGRATLWVDAQNWAQLEPAEEE